MSMLQSTEDRLKAKQAEVLKRLCRHPVNSDVNWEGVARLASFEAMVSAILGRPEAVHDDSIDWHPEGDSGGHAGDHHHGDHAIVAHAADAVVQAAAAAFSGLMGGLGGGGFVAKRQKRSRKEAVGALKEAVGMRKSPSEIALVAEDGAGRASMRERTLPT